VMVFFSRAQEARLVISRAAVSFRQPCKKQIVKGGRKRRLPREGKRERDVALRPRRNAGYRESRARLPRCESRIARRASSGSLLTSSCLSIVRRERGRYPVDKSACLIKVTSYEDKVAESLRDLAINYALPSTPRSLNVT